MADQNDLFSQLSGLAGGNLTPQSLGLLQMLMSGPSAGGQPSPTGGLMTPPGPLPGSPPPPPMPATVPFQPRPPTPPIPTIPGAPGNPTMGAAPGQTQLPVPAGGLPPGMGQTPGGQMNPMLAAILRQRLMGMG
jgi:hypothetical protein